MMNYPVTVVINDYQNLSIYTNFEKSGILD